MTNTPNYHQWTWRSRGIDDQAIKFFNGVGQIWNCCPVYGRIISGVTLGQLEQKLVYHTVRGSISCYLVSFLCPHVDVFAVRMSVHIRLAVIKVFLALFDRTLYFFIRVADQIKCNLIESIESIRCRPVLTVVQHGRFQILYYISRH